ncbi:MAG TPA: beta-propeller fold lactonase family protein [Candidatus Angelobacter sp.]|nr:beta-propeller fold lactonase family protein [Candidatus Angelobacter sp.]
MCLILLPAAGALAQNNFVYTDDNNRPNTVSAFRVADDGSLTLIAGSPFPTGGNGGGNNVDPQEITTAATGATSFLYAGNNGDGTVSGFLINPQTGTLLAVPGSPFAAGTPNGNFSLTPSPDGQFLFTTDDSAPNIHVFSISSQTGTLSEIAGSPFTIAGQAQGLKVSPNGKFLVAGLRSNNAVATFAIAANGALTPVGVFPASGAATAEDVNCKSNRVYNVNAGSTLIDAYQLDDGVLTPVPGSPFSNGSASGSFGLVLSPSGPFLFASDGFGSKISSLSIDPNGALHSVPGSPFSSFDWTSQVATTADGRFVYAALFAQGAVDAHSASSAGVLAPVPGTPFRTGQSAVGVVTITTFPAPTCSQQ